MKNPRFYLGAIIICLLAGNMVSYGANYDEQLRGVKKNIQDVKKQKYDREQALKELNHIMIVLDEKIDESEKKIDKINTDIDEKEAEITSSQIKIEKFQANIEKNTDILSERLKVMYRTSEIDYLRVVLDSENIEEALSNVTMIKKIVKKDQEVLAQLKDSREKEEDEKKNLEKQQRQMVSLRTGLQAEKESLEKSMLEQDKNKAILKQDLVKLELMEEEMLREANALESKIRELQRVNGVGGAYIGGSMAWPVAIRGRVTSGYGGRVNPISKRNEFHSGVDIAAPSGTGILAANDGKVIFAGNRGTYGKAIMVDHGGGIVTLYAHCSAFVASEGQTVKRGQVIAKIGSTGYSTGPHLHFEVRVNGKHVNPSGYIGLR